MRSLMNLPSIGGHTVAPVDLSHVALGVPLLGSQGSRPVPGCRLTTNSRPTGPRVDYRRAVNVARFSTCRIDAIRVHHARIGIQHRGIRVQHGRNADVQLRVNPRSPSPESPFSEGRSAHFTKGRIHLKCQLDSISAPQATIGTGHDALSSRTDSCLRGLAPSSDRIPTLASAS